MSSPAQFRGSRKALRDAFQAVLAVLAAGGATVAFETFVGTVAPAWSGLLAVLFKIVIAYAQNYLETNGNIGVMLPTPGLVVAGPVVDMVSPPIEATVEAVTDVAGGVTGVVTDVAGGSVVGKVVGSVRGIRRRAKADDKPDGPEADDSPTTPVAKPKVDE